MKIKSSIRMAVAGIIEAQNNIAAAAADLAEVRDFQKELKNNADQVSKVIPNLEKIGGVR